jgi:hydroxymethylbilane synthase
MEMTECVTSVISMEEMLPAVGQGAIGVQCRSDDNRALQYIQALNHENTKMCVDCERAFLATLDGNCRTPIAGQAIIDEHGVMCFKGILAKHDGSEIYETSEHGPPSDAVAIGKRAGEVLKARAPHLVGVPV